MAQTILHLDQSRSGGHLLQRILSDQPKRHLLDHPFSQARGKQVQWFINEHHADGMPDDLQKEWESDVTKGMKIWERGLSRAQVENKILVIQDHCFNPAPPSTVLHILDLISNDSSTRNDGENVTGLPENLLLQPGLIPLFTIRDPRLAVPSAYRVLQKFGLPAGGGRANFSVSTNLVWIRLMYNWFVAHGVEPVIVDCDDVQLSEGTDFLQRLCGRLGLDAERVKVEWESVTEKEKAATHPSFWASQSRLLESRGLQRELAAKGRDWVKEEEAWEEEFGGDVGLVREMVREAERHYGWLLERRFQ